ncbi:unnamed protein product [Cuscuta europaea]|uniref:Ubiquitin-like protease family profile domain-containing protein n=1 Tax=Cuscuta europaea TaxID=41803 RepID=A0A9P0ZIF8_CUSEU|nr:unnamed protein product [Cuscuta europaea]
MNSFIDAKTMFDSEERLVAGFVFHDHCDKNSVVLFKNHYLTLSKVQLETLQSNLKVDVEVIDVWAMMLNHNEKLKSDGAKSRLLFSTKPCQVLDQNHVSAPQTRNKRFLSAIAMKFPKADVSKLRIADIFIFPDQQNGCYYLMCFDLKNMKFYIIDSSDGDICIGVKYLFQPSYLKNGFVKWLPQERHPKADQVVKLKQNLSKCIGEITKTEPMKECI